RRTRRRPGVPHRPAEPSGAEERAWPSPADVIRGWEARLRRGARFELPDPRLGAAVEANRAFLLLFHTGESITPALRGGAARPASFREAAPMVVTLDRLGFHGEAAEVLRARPWRSPGCDSGRFLVWEAHAGGLWALAEHHRMTGDTALLGE